MTAQQISVLIKIAETTEQYRALTKQPLVFASYFSSAISQMNDVISQINPQVIAFVINRTSQNRL